MAEVIDDLIERLKDYRDGLPDMVVEILEASSSIIEDMNIAQLQKGERADGEILPNY